MFPPNIEIYKINMQSSECYDITFGFQGGSLWGLRAQPPFNNAEGCKRWIDTHPILRNIVIARWIDEVQSYCDTGVGTNVVVVAILRVYECNNRRLFNILSRQVGLSFDVTNCKHIVDESVAARTKARRLSHTFE